MFLPPPEKAGVEPARAPERGVPPPAAAARARLQRDDPGQHAQRRGLAGAVAPDDPDRLAPLDPERHSLEGGHRRRAADPPPEQHALERAGVVGADVEPARGVAKHDFPRSKLELGLAHRPHTTTASSPSILLNTSAPAPSVAAAMQTMYTSTPHPGAVPE